MAMILVCHGAWSGGWSWQKMRAPLSALGHDLAVPTYTGLGERTHLVNPGVGLDTHVQDVLAVIEYEDLDDLVLLGHSYGGMVATGVADRVGRRVAHIIYLDAFVPDDGESVFDLRTESAAAMRERAKTEGDGWLLPPITAAADLTEEDRAWMDPRRSPLPLKCFEEKLALAGNASGVPKSYIYCRDKTGRDDPFRAIGDRVRGRPGWQYLEMDTSHTPNITAPDDLARLIDTIVAGGR